MSDLCLMLAVKGSLGERLAVCGVSVLVGIILIVVGWHNIRTQTAEETGKRKLVLRLFGKSGSYAGRRAVWMGVMRIGIGIAAILFGIVFLFVGPFLKK